MQGTEQQVAWAIKIQAEKLSEVEAAIARTQGRMRECIAKRMTSGMRACLAELGLLDEIKAAIAACDQAEALINGRSITIEELLEEFPFYQKNNSLGHILVFEDKTDTARLKVLQENGCHLWGLVRHYFMGISPPEFKAKLTKEDKSDD
jgi:hypothetical protein